MKKILLLLCLILILSGCSTQQEEIIEDEVIEEGISEEVPAESSAVSAAISEIVEEENEPTHITDYERQDQTIRDSIYFCVKAANVLIEYYDPDREDWINTSDDFNKEVNEAIDKLAVTVPPAEYEDYHYYITNGLNHLDDANDLIFLASYNDDPSMLGQAKESLTIAIHCFVEAGL
jgi:hypothetical protein